MFLPDLVLDSSHPEISTELLVLHISYYIKNIFLTFSNI